MVAVLFACTVSARPLVAQRPTPLQPEVRLDAITGSDWAVHLGLGLTTAMGTYVRAGAITAIGAGRTESGKSAAGGRTDVIARFNLDPFRERRWAPYAVGGISARYGDQSRTTMLLGLGMEGPLWGRLTPAVEVGLGGGVRIAAVLRRGMPRRR